MPLPKGVTPVPLGMGPKVVLHVVPHSCFAQPAPFLDLKSASFLSFGTEALAAAKAKTPRLARKWGSLRRRARPPSDRGAGKEASGSGLLVRWSAGAAQ